MGLQQSKIYYGAGQCVEHYYLCNYRPLHAGGDSLSRSLIRFKEALAFDLQAWTDCVIRELTQLKFPDDVTIIRALGSNETFIDSHTDTALDKLGKTISTTFNINWMPELIRKPKRTKPLKSLNNAERWAEIKGAYCISLNQLKLNSTRFLLIDDIVTTGATIISIIRLIKQHLPGSMFKVFTLAKSAYDNSLNASLRLAGTGYAWEENSGWMVAEGEAEYKSYAHLSACILNDDFSRI